MNLCEQINSSINKLDIKYTSNDNAMQMIRNEIYNMAYEIEQSTKGTRGQVGYGVDAVRTDTKSTFPKYLQEIFKGNGTTKKFLSAVKKGKGIVWTRIALEAINRLEHGYINDHGYDEPNKDFIKEVNNPTPF